ncbi:MAG: DUF3782 domain-containing protein [Methylococcales bacterium]|nr:DUF3782 domain-containing protein [Methylococcales bacterium]
MTDQELKDLVASLSINQQKMAEEAAISRKNLNEELAESSKKLNKELAETRKKLSEEVAESDKKLNDYLAKSRKENDKGMKELRQQIGGIANKFGSFTEGLALPSMTKILTKKFGMTTINPSVRVRDKNGNEQEIDVLAYANGEINTAFIVEVKSHLREEGIEQLLKQCRDFPVLFPELAHKKLYGILAAVDANQQLQQKVLAHGLYFAKIHDEQFSRGYELLRAIVR